MKLTNEMIERIRAEVQKALPNHEVKAQEVMRNNGGILHGIIIKRPNDNVAPTIYIEHCLTNNELPNDLSELADKIVDVYNNTIKSQHISNLNNVGELLKDFEQVKSMLRIRLVNKDANAKLFETIPYMPFLDMAIIAVVELQQTAVGSATVKVTNELLKCWGKTFSELLPFANTNTFKNPYVLTNMFDMMLDILNEMFPNIPKEMKQEMIGSFPNEPRMYVLTNQNKHYGATEICNYATMKTIADTLGSDLCILPSSLHEIIIIPRELNMDNIDIQYFRGLVQEVNGTQVAAEDVLSDNVYVFTREHGWKF